MIETVLARSLRRMFAGGAAAGIALLALPALPALAQEVPAQDAAPAPVVAQDPAAPPAPVPAPAPEATIVPVPAQEVAPAPAVAQVTAEPPQAAPVQRVEITGSSIRRLASETSLPITTMRAADFAKQGLTTAQEVLATIPMNQTSQSSSQSVGSGTGGRAVADLRGLGGDKTLVLLNGRRLANHPFFADTIDLNIIPVAALDRVEVLRDGASAIYGTDAIGGVINFITKRSVKGIGLTFEGYEPMRSGGGSEQRLNLTGGWGDLNEDGYNFFLVGDAHQQAALKSIDRKFSSTGVRPDKGVSQTSGTPFPANFFSDNGVAGNPFFASGCLPPASIPSATSPTCRFDFTRFIDDIPQTEQFTVLGKFTKKFGEHIGAIEYLHSRSTNTSRVAPPPLAGIGLIMTSDSPFYPGGSAGVPAFPGLTGEPLDISWRPLVTGQREQFDSSNSDRFVASMEGTFGAWDYSTGFTHSMGRAKSKFTGGYVIDQRIIDGVAAGILNPFGDQTVAGTEFLNRSLLIGEFLDAKIRTTAIDVRASRDLTTLPAGPLGFAIGGEYRHDKASYTVNRDLASQASSSGYADAQDQGASRNIGAVFAELNIPVIKDLEINLAGRYDDYSDVGDSFTPKISVRWQPTRQVLLRGSFNKGFRAPTLYDLSGPQTVTNTSDTYNDPVLCPTGTAVPGANPNLVCDQQQNIRQGGNPDLAPETSKTYSAGVVFEPSRALTISLDYWQIRLEDTIGGLPEQTIFGNFPKYQSLFQYTGNRLDFVSAITDNLGEVKTRGLDLGLLWRLPTSTYGNFTLNLEGTYVNKYDYQNERGGDFVQNAGRYADAAPVFRWRHNAVLGWNLGDWTVNLSNKYLSHYDDQNAVAPEFAQSVDHYSTWALSGTFTGNKKVDFTAGIKNLLDESPPFTNQNTTFQQGYDPRFTDPLGFTVFMRATYKF